MFNFSERLRAIRLASGKTQEETAVAVGAAPRALQNWEYSHRKPGLDSLVFLAAFFKVSLDYLLGKSDANTHVVSFDPHAVLDNFPSRLKQLRKLHNKTQTEIASSIGIATRSYRVWEQGNAFPSFELIIPLADCFHISIDELAGLEAPELSPTAFVSSIIEAKREELIKQLRNADEELLYEVQKVVDNIDKKSRKYLKDKQ